MSSSPLLPSHHPLLFHLAAAKCYRKTTGDKSAMEPCFPSLLQPLSGRCTRWASFFERGLKKCSFSTLTSMFSRSILMFLSFLYLFLVMSNLTVEKLEEILEEKLRKVIQPLSKQIEVLQKKAFRIITFSGFFEHTSPLFKDLNVDQII